MASLLHASRLSFAPGHRCLPSPLQLLTLAAPLTSLFLGELLPS